MTSISSQRIISSYKEGWDPYKIFKQDALLANAMRAASNSSYNDNVPQSFHDRLKELKFTPSDARLLSYLIYISKKKSSEKDGYFRFRQNILCERLGFKSRDTIRRATKKLVGLRLIQITSEFNEGLVLGQYPNTTLWYKVNLDKILSIIGDYKEIEVLLLKYALANTRKEAVKKAANKEKAVVKTAEKIHTRMHENIVRKRFRAHGWITYPEKYQQLKSISASYRSKNKIRFYFYQTPEENFFNQKIKKKIFKDKVQKQNLLYQKKPKNLDRRIKGDFQAIEKRPLSPGAFNSLGAVLSKMEITSFN